MVKKKFLGCRQRFTASLNKNEIIRHMACILTFPPACLQLLRFQVFFLPRVYLKINYRHLVKKNDHKLFNQCNDMLSAVNQINSMKDVSCWDCCCFFSKHNWTTSQLGVEAHVYLPSPQQTQAVDHLLTNAWYR